MVATSALVAAVSGSHFALGTALSKTEAVQAALLGLILLGEGVIRPSAWRYRYQLGGRFFALGQYSP